MSEEPEQKTPAEIEEALRASATPLKQEIAERDRITLVQYVTHEHEGDIPLQITNRNGRDLTSDEQAWSRRVKIGEEWTPLPDPWFAQELIECLLIENLAGVNPKVNPSPERLAEIAKQIIEVSTTGHSQDAWRVRPGWPFFGEANSPADVKLRCASGVAPVRITIFPR